VKPELAVLIGDTVTDIEASLLVGVRSIGYAAKPGRREELERAKADFVIASMAALA
jgi:phosphoglycolate phosphatase